MQFVDGGPDVPDRLIQAHEDGRVIFFCGAGISYPAGLPGFKELVKALYRRMAIAPSPVQSAALKRKQYDTAIDLLERDVVGGRALVRQHIAEILTPDLRRRVSTETHEALLSLAKDPKGKRRLVTTNCDRLFEVARARLVPEMLPYQAPQLPVPKSSRWNGLVYLHGLLPEDADADCWNRLVLSSGDFGLAYLTERWASRFVTELLRGYFTVCFVGYSIDDPVLRYVMDALAADRMLGESPPEVFAFGSFAKGRFEEVTNEWRAKNVTPILYAEHRKHLRLHTTLRAWADIHRDGILGKESIIVRHAATRPQGGAQEDFVGRVLWALADPSGVPAKTFATLDPAPPIEWLGPLSEPRFKYADLVRFGVQPDCDVDQKLTFSLTRRPSPYAKSPWMALAGSSHWMVGPGQWDNVMEQIARWFVRHLDKPEALAWVLDQGVCLHPFLLDLINDELKKGALPAPLATVWQQFVSRRVACG